MELTLTPLAYANRDDDFFGEDNLVLPAGIDRDILVPLMIAETAELEVLYSDPDTFAWVMHAWSSARASAWGSMLAALTAEYNPIHNYDRHETASGTEGGTETYTHTGTNTVLRTGTDTMARTGTDTIARTGTDAVADTGDTTEQVEGFNQAGWANKAKTTLGTTKTETRNLSDAETRNLTDQETRNLSDAETRNLTDARSRSLTDSKTLHAYGNIGVTTSQQMITSELELRKLDVYHIIVREFARRFCLGVY